MLAEVRAGTLAPEEAARRIRAAPFEDLGFAKVDHGRELRQGAAEVVYGEGKTAKRDRRLDGLVPKMPETGRRDAPAERIARRRERRPPARGRASGARETPARAPRTHGPGIFGSASFARQGHAPIPGRILRARGIRLILRGEKTILRRTFTQKRASARQPSRRNP